MTIVCMKLIFGLEREESIPRPGEALLTSFLDSLPDDFAELDAVVFL